MATKLTRNVSPSRMRARQRLKGRWDGEAWRGEQAGDVTSQMRVGHLAGTPRRISCHGAQGLLHSFAKYEISHSPAFK